MHHRLGQPARVEFRDQGGQGVDEPADPVSFAGGGRSVRSITSPTRPARLSGVRRDRPAGGVTAAWAATKRAMVVRTTSGEAFQQSSPGTWPSRTRRPTGSEATTAGTIAGSASANAAVTPPSSAANPGVTFSQTGPPDAGMRNSPARFQDLTCRDGPSAGRPAARSASSAQARASRTPWGVAHGERPAGMSHRSAAVLGKGVPTAREAILRGSPRNSA
ncbi:hypothetical protein ACLQ2R_10500 [Streptosporangium sp. DT93]|uniref:hypothetical protein n=1 Tax=Streptosporangium sp. DT93 TaxID=3393428 RepID=UPI003CFB8BC6